jgi:hypothetical protein
MRGLPDFNYPTFTKVSADLRSRGYTVVNPAELTEPTAPRTLCMYRDIKALLECDAIAMLPGWDTSPGAILELEIARQIGLPAFDAISLEPIERSA